MFLAEATSLSEAIVLSVAPMLMAALAWHQAAGAKKNTKTRDGDKSVADLVQEQTVILNEHLEDDAFFQGFLAGELGLKVPARRK